MRKLYFLSLLLATSCWISPVKAVTAERTHLMIAVVQTGEADATGNDLVVVHNPTNAVVDITEWKLQYRAATAKGNDTWTTKRVFGCQPIKAGCRLRIAAKDNIIASTYALAGITAIQPLSSGFSDEGGQIRLSKPTTGSKELITVDMVGYGTAVEAEGKAALAPALGKAIVRKSTAATGLVDTQQNKNDFTEGCYKASLNKVPVVTACSDEPDTTPTDPDEEDDAYPVLVITELLPNPVSPATDSKDEFIEIFNPTSRTVSLKGYTLQAGSDGKHSFTFKEGSVAAQSYIAVMSAVSHISLTNEGTPVRLLDPSGKEVSNVPSYGQAKSGAAWVRADGVWQWTVRPTPNAANILSIEPPEATVQPAVATTKKTATTKKAVSKTTMPKAVKGASTTKKTAPKASVAAKTVAAAPPQPEAQNNFNYVLFVCVGLGVLAYAGYEYRHEISRIATKIWHAARGHK